MCFHLTKRRSFMSAAPPHVSLVFSFVFSSSYLTMLSHHSFFFSFFASSTSLFFCQLPCSNWRPDQNHQNKGWLASETGSVGLGKAVLLVWRESLWNKIMRLLLPSLYVSLKINMCLVSAFVDALFDWHIKAWRSKMRPGGHLWPLRWFSVVLVCNSGIAQVYFTIRLKQMEAKRCRRKNTNQFFCFNFNFIVCNTKNIS